MSKDAKDYIIMWGCKNTAGQHAHLWNEDEAAFSICTATYEYQQEYQRAVYEADQNL